MLEVVPYPWFHYVAIITLESSLVEMLHLRRITQLCSTRNMTAAVTTRGVYSRGLTRPGMDSHPSNGGPSGVSKALLISAGVATAAYLSTATTTCEPNAENKMYYRMLGNTGLKVSVLSYGFWATFGSKADLKAENEGMLS